MISVQDVSRRFADVTALDGMTWAAQPGQITVLLGPNGAGKTTCVEIVEGLQRRDGGSVEVLGADPWRAGPEHRARVGIMLQDGGLTQAARPLTLLRHLARLYTAPCSLDDLSSRLDLAELASRPVRRLSRGQRQRVALAAALIGDPDVLILDEPSAGVDPHVRRRVWDLLAERRDAGDTVVLTTHSFAEAERLGDTIVVVNQGRTVAHGTPAELAGSGSLEEAYFALTDGAAG